MGDFVPGYEASAWLGIGAPKDTPGEIIGMLNGRVNAGLADPAIKTRIADLGRHGTCNFARRVRQAHSR